MTWNRLTYFLVGKDSTILSGGLDMDVHGVRWWSDMVWNLSDPPRSTMRHRGRSEVIEGMPLKETVDSYLLLFLHLASRP
jgi:hypothetical protein